MQLSVLCSNFYDMFLLCVFVLFGAQLTILMLLYGKEHHKYVHSEHLALCFTHEGKAWQCVQTDDAIRGCN